MNYMVIIITDKKIKLLKLMLAKKQITIKDQNIYSPLAFRINMTQMESAGIVERCGIKEKKNLWKLTEKGERIAKHLNGGDFYGT